MTDSYVPTLNADGDIQNVATQQSERGGATIETQEFALTQAQVTALTPPANPDPSTETKQDDLITAIGTLQTTVEALTTAVGLLAKLTDTQPVNAAITTIAAESTANSYSTELAEYGEYFTGTFEDVSQYVEITVSLYEETGGDFSYIYIDWSSDGINVDKTQEIISEYSGGVYSIQVLSKYMRIRCVSN